MASCQRLAASLFVVSTALSIVHAAGNGGTHATCKLTITGLAPSAAGEGNSHVASSIRQASLHCEGAPVKLSVNATHLGEYAVSFTGIEVDKSQACQVTAPVAFDFLENTDIPLGDSHITVYPLICFFGDYELELSELLIENVELDYNSASTGFYTTALLAFGGNVAANIKAATIQNNKAGSPLLLVGNSQVVLEQSKLVANAAVLGGATAAWGRASLTVKQSALSGKAITKGGAVFSIASTRLTMTETVVSDSSAVLGGGIYIGDSPVVSITASRLLRNSAAEYGGAMLAVGSAKVTINGGICKDNTAGTWGGCFDAEGSSNVTTTGGFNCISNTADEAGGCASGSGSPTIAFASSILQGNTASSGGAVYVEGDASVTVLDGSQISSNSATADAGGVWAKDASKLTVINSFILGNKAVQGGGLSVWDSAFALITDSTISSNAAKYYGGAAAALGAESKLVIESSRLVANRAALGGAVRASDTATLVFRSASKLMGNSAAVDGGAVYVADGARLEVSLGNVATNNTAGRLGGGVVLLNQNASLSDVSQAFVKNLAAFDEDVSVRSTTLTLTSRPNTDFVSYTGANQVLLKTRLDVTGLFGLPTGGMLVQAVLENGNDLILGAALSDNNGLVSLDFPFRVPPGCYKVRYSLVLNVDLAHFGRQTNSSVVQTVCVIPCRPGEVTASSGDACEVCAAGSYSLNPANHTCDACPQGASCPGRALILPLPGHWHSSPRSHQVHRCPNPGACQGNLSATMQLVTANPCLNATLGLTPCEGTTLQAYTDQQCTSGYRGNLCGVCASGYSMSRQFTCGKCLMSKGAIVALVVLGAVAMLAVMRLQVHWTLSEQPSAHYDHDPLRRTDLCKALVLYMQYMLIVLFAINTSWPSSVVYVLQAPLAWLWSAYSSQTLSIQCLVPDSTGAVPQAMVQQLFYVVTPLVTVLLLLLIEATVFAFARKVPSAASVLRRFVGTALVVAFFCLPFTTRTIVNMFACLPVDHPTQAPYVVNAVGSYWTLDMGQMCYQGYHRAWALGLGLPLLVLVCVMLPAGVALLLVLNRGRLNERTFQNQFGFLFRSYRPSVCWWEAVVLCQTIMLVVITVFGHVLGPYLQGLVLFAALALIGIVLLVVRPYAHPEAGRVMLAGVGCLMLTSYASLLFLEPGYGQSVRPEVAQVIGVGLLMINVAYVTYVVIRLFMIVKWGKVYHNIRPGVHTSAAAAKQLAPKFSATSSLVLTGSSGLKFKSSGSVGLSPQPSNIPAGLHNTRSSSFSPVMGPSNQSLPVVNGLSNQSLSFVGSGRSSRQLLPVGSGGLSAPQPCVSASGLSQPLMSFQLQPPAMQPSPFASSTVNKP